MNRLGLLLTFFLVSTVTNQAEEPVGNGEPPQRPNPNTATLADILAFEKALETWMESLPDTRRWEIHEENAAGRFGDSSWPPRAEYRWKDSTVSLRLVGTEVGELEESGVLLKRSEVFKQSFQAYTSPEAVPFFITTDSLLNGYHVLLESSLQRAAMQERSLLRDFLVDLYAALEVPGEYDRFDPKQKPELIAHAQRVLGPALVILGEEPEFASRRVEEDVNAVVEMIRHASTVALPHWLAPAEEDFLAIDFRRMKPIGFFTRHPDLQAFFQAMEWLRAVPFRLDRKSEFFTYGSLANISFESPMSGQLRRIDGLGSFFGEPNGVDLEQAGSVFQNFRMSLYTGGEDEARQFALAMLQFRGDFPIERVGQSWRLKPREESGSESYNLYLFVPRVLPDDRLFQQVMKDSDGADPLPSGMEWAVFLGSSWTMGKLEELGAREKVELVRSRKAVRDLSYQAAAHRSFREWAGAEKFDAFQSDPDLALYTKISSVYSAYLHALEALFLTPEPEAPGWMESEVWQKKSAETALASWAQMRHSLSMIAPRGAMYMGLIVAPPGFVEPNPEFFGRMAQLIKETRHVLERSGVIGNPELDRLFVLQSNLEFIDKNIEAEGRWFESISEREQQEEWNLQAYDLSLDWEFFRDGEPEKWGVKKWQEAQALLRAELRELENHVEGLDAGERSQDPMDQRWATLFELALMLESLSHKQLRGVDWNEREAQFIRQYGEELASVMLYDGNSWLTPIDDAPRIVGIYENPGVGKILHVGIGRPHAVYVLYPWKGASVLCRGAVLPYFEFPYESWLSDDAWRTMESDSAHPSWLEE